MADKLLFYQRYGVQEYYIKELTGFIRNENWFESISDMNGWVSPLLEIRFQLTQNNLEIYRPDGRKFLTPVELDRLREQERQRAEQEHQRAEEAIAQLDREQQRYQTLLEKLREQGINPEQL
ncbi:conserved hypothetical protein [Kamptonema sp. PCC 6506]|nr:conserved hypothetical protein [Kamptonema sp. PCC 6506]